MTFTNFFFCIAKKSLNFRRVKNCGVTMSLFVHRIDRKQLQLKYIACFGHSLDELRSSLL